MISAADVLHVARTSQPHSVTPEGPTLTIDDVVRLTTSDDWDGALYELHARPATEIAIQFNLTHKLGPQPAIRVTPKTARLNGRQRKAVTPKTT